MSLPAPAPSADNSDGREPGRAAVRGWELIRNLQVEPLPRRPHRRRIMEGERELRGGGMRLEFVRGGMGRSRRPGGRSNNNFQNRSVLLPDCVPESARRIADENGDESGFNRDGPFELSAGNDGATHETRGAYISQRPDLCEGPTNNEPDAVGPNIRNSSGQVEAHQVPVQAPLEPPQAPLEALQVPPEAPQVPIEQALFKVEGCSPQEIVGEPQRADPVPLIPYLQNMTIMGELSILETSTLSPNAREFIPTSKQVSSMSGQLPGTVSNETDEVYPTNSSRYYQNGEQVSATGAYSYQDETLEYFDQMVETLHLVESELIKHPANFHNMMKHIACAVPQWLQSNLAVSLANSVINMGMNHKNFGYIAARMCVFISKLDPSNVFRTSLINRCHEICQNLPEQRKCATFVWFVMFLAELYVQFKNERGQRVNVIGTGLLECLENLISEPVVYDNLKFFCNALKLAGHYLDTDLKTPMNQLMTHIQSVMTAVGFDNVDSRMYNQLQRIIDMRNNNWDIQSAASLERQEEDGNNVSNSGTYYSLSDAVFYGPDGQVLTQEESQFLTENQSLGECNQSESFDEDSSKEDSNDSMDEEMQVAYEQFLQMVPGRQ